MTTHCHLTIDNTLTRIHNYGTVLNPGKGTVYYVWLQSALAGMSNKCPNYQGVLIFWSAYMISIVTKCVDYADPIPYFQVPSLTGFTTYCYQECIIHAAYWHVLCTLAVT